MLSAEGPWLCALLTNHYTFGSLKIRVKFAGMKCLCIINKSIVVDFTKTQPMWIQEVYINFALIKDII